MAQSKLDSQPASTGTCPICGATTQPALRPFCSKRCADVDLMRWLRGAYTIQSTSDDDDEDGNGADPADTRSTE